MTHPVGHALQAVKLDIKFRKREEKTWNHMKSNIIVFIDSIIIGPVSDFNRLLDF